LVGAFIAGDFTEEEDGYWVCVEVHEIKDVPDGMVSLEVPRQKYAVISHNGTKHEIRNTYERKSASNYMTLLIQTTRRGICHWENTIGMKKSST